MRVAVIGDYGLDTYHVGRVRGVSAEAPIPVLTDIRSHTLPAMAGNVVSNLRYFGVTVDDIHPGDSQRSLRPCPDKNRLYTTDGVQLARWDIADTCEPYTLDDLVPLLTHDIDAVVVCDYGKGSITQEVVDLLCDTTLPVFVDTKGDPRVWIGSETAVLFPNLDEYRRYTDSYNWCERVVLKRGAEGNAYLNYGKVVVTGPPMVVTPRCVNGAGDTALAAFVSAALASYTLPECLEAANRAAAIVVSQHFLLRTPDVEAYTRNASSGTSGGSGVADSGPMADLAGDGLADAGPSPVGSRDTSGAATSVVSITSARNSRAVAMPYDQMEFPWD